MESGIAEADDASTRSSGARRKTTRPRRRASRTTGRVEESGGHTAQDREVGNRLAYCVQVNEQHTQQDGRTCENVWPQEQQLVAQRHGTQGQDRHARCNVATQDDVPRGARARAAARPPRASLPAHGSSYARESRK